MHGLSNPKVITGISGIVLASILLLPDLHFSPLLPAIQVIDLLMPFLVFILYFNRKLLVWNTYFTLILGFGVLILVSLAINQRMNILNEYFEIYKFLKFLILIVFFSLCDFQLLLQQWLRPVFLVLVGVNFIHFFNLFDFNTIIENHYNGGLNITYFGIDTLGNPTGKRMLGFMANPNNNAILFSFFSLIFFPFKLEKNKLAWFSVALICLFMCQSRTSLIAVLAIVAVLFLLKLVHWNTKQIFQFSAILLGTYLIAWMFSSSFFKYPIYGNSMFNGVALESQSAMGRLEAWRFLGKMILEKPIFGHGPNKDFFYENRIYSENEYVLYAWRYGIVGLTGFILLFLIPLKKAWKSREKFTSALLILVVVLLTVTALTNNPFTERTILVFFALILGVFYQNNPVNQKTTL